MRKTLALAFSLLGLFASTYLWWMYTSPSVPMVCMGQGCEVVRASRFAHIYDVPMPVFGVLMYTTLVLALLAEPIFSARFGKLLRHAVLAISAAGFLASLYLTALEAFVIHAYCMWCVVQAISISLVLVFAWKARTGYGNSDAALRGVRQQFVTLLAALIVGIPAFMLLQHKTRVAPAALPAVSEQSIAEHLLRADSHTLGNANAPVTVIEFGDLQCPSCAAANRTNHEMQSRFGSQVRFVFRHFPMPSLHPYALKAAEASECAAEQGKFWEAVDRFYQSEGKLDLAALRRYASEMGLDVGRFNTCLDTSRMAERVRRDAEDGRFLGVRSTPTFIVGRQMIEGVLDSPRFAQVIAAELSKGDAQSAVNAAPATVNSAPTDTAAKAPESKQPAPQASRPLPAPKAPAVATANAPGSRPRISDTNLGNPSAPVAGLPAPAPSAGLPGFGGSSSPFTMLQGSSGCDTAPTGPEPTMIHTREARELFRDHSVFVDVRSPEDFRKRRIAGAVNIPIGEIGSRAKDLPRDRVIVLYENSRGSGADSCALSRAAARTLMARGFQRVKVYQDGLTSWEKEGLPLQH